MELFIITGKRRKDVSKIKGVEDPQSGVVLASDFLRIRGCIGTAGNDKIGCSKIAFYKSYVRLLPLDSQPNSNLNDLIQDN